MLGQFVGIRDELVTLLRELGYDATADQETDPEPVFSAWFVAMRYTQVENAEPPLKEFRCRKALRYVS